MKHWNFCFVHNATVKRARSVSGVTTWR